MAMNDNGYFVNIQRSSVVRNKLKVLRENLHIPYMVIGKKSTMTSAVLSQFVHNTRDLNDQSLDRLEPVVDAYLKVMENTDELLRG